MGANNWPSSGSIEKSETVTISGEDPISCTSLSSGDTVRVVWSAPGGGRTEIVGEYEVI
jgi:hypothetical protein